MKEPSTSMHPVFPARRLPYRFRSRGLLLQAFRHASYVNEHAEPGLADNERLEFLGDAVLDLAVSHLLMDRFPDAAEGDLSRLRATVVDEGGLCQVAQELQLGQYLLLGKGEEQTGGREKPSILANTLEALLGAVYLDGGFDKAFRVIQNCFGPVLEKLVLHSPAHDFKSALQEWTQRRYGTLPQYQVMEETGPAHNRFFTVSLFLNGEPLSTGQGKSKKEAEQDAARNGFEILKTH